MLLHLILILCPLIKLHNEEEERIVVEMKKTIYRLNYNFYVEEYKIDELITQLH